MNKEDKIEARIKEKDAKIEKYVKDKDLSIRVSWAINNAVAMVAPKITMNPQEQQEAIREWADCFLADYEILRDREAGKLAEGDNEEKPL